MIEAGSLEYASARLAARHGERPDEGLWRRIETLRDFAAVVTTVRASNLAPWITGIGTDALPHAVEAAMRRRWREIVAEVADWMPPAWRDAVRWCALLADFPVLLHLAHRGAPLPWIADDPEYGDVAQCALKDASEAAAQLTIAAAGGPRRLQDAWRAEWTRKLPSGALAGTQLAALVTLLDAHRAAFAGTPRSAGWRERRALQARITSLFHRASVDPAVAFIHLALRALEYERLRGELLTRRVFPQRRLAA
jgi:hypothetical protein